METWSEDDSDLFLEYGRAFPPEWESLRSMFVRLIPPLPAGGATVCVEIGAGSGWLSEAILLHDDRAHVIALDGSRAMLAATADRLARHKDRLEARHFDLTDLHWLDSLPANVHAVVSSLALHHLDDPQKRTVYAGLFEKIAPGGALLIADLVQPLNPVEQAAFADAWDDAVKRQSLDLFGDGRAYDAFCSARWNYYRYPDPVDKPARLPDMLHWLQASGFEDVDVFWEHAGHVLVGGYKKASASH